MSKSRTRSVLINTGAGIGVRLLTLLMNFVLKTVFIKILGIQYTGVSSLFTDILTILSFAELGIGSAITYALYKPVAENDELQIVRLMNFYRKAYRCVAAIVLVAGVALVPFLRYLVKDVPDIKENITIIYLLYLANAAGSYLLIYKSAILVAKQKKYVISCIEGITNICRLLVESCIIVISHKFILYLVIDIVFTVAQNCVIGRFADMEYTIKNWEKGLMPDIEERKRLFADVKALAMYQISGVVLNGADSVIISAFLETSLVGYISYYKLIFDQISKILVQFFDAMNPSVGNLAASEGREKQYELFKKTNFTIFWLLCISCTGLVLCVNPLISLWIGDEYVLPFSITLVLAADFYVTNMIRIVAVFRNANGLFVDGKYRPIIMAALNILLSVILVKQLGVFGVLLATVISRLVTQMWYDPWLVYRKVFACGDGQHKVREYFRAYAMYLATIIMAITLGKAVVAVTMKTRVISKWGMLIASVIISIVVSNLMVLVLWRKKLKRRENE